MTDKEYRHFMDILDNHRYPHGYPDGYTIVYDDGSELKVTQEDMREDIYGDPLHMANDNWYSAHVYKDQKKIAYFVIDGEEIPYDFVQGINNDEFDAKHRFDDEYSENTTFNENKKTMKKLNITKEQFNRSNYFQRKYGKLEYVSESGKLFKTNKGNVLKFVKESFDDDDEAYGDGEWHVFDYGPDFPYVERYTVLDPEGYEFFIGHNGGVGSYDGEQLSYSTSQEICDELTTKIDGQEYEPVEIPYEDAIKDKTIRKGLAQIKELWDYNEEGEYNESTKKIVKGGALSEDAILDAIPVDARDGLVDINEPDGSFGNYTWYVRFAPFSDEEAKSAADGIKQVTGRRTQVAGAGREIYVLVMDYPSRPTNESKKLVKEYENDDWM